MALKQITFKERRSIWLDSMEQRLKEFEIEIYTYSGQIAKLNYKDVQNELFKKGLIPSKKLSTCVKEYYGYSNNENNSEFKLARILYLKFLLSYHKIFEFLGLINDQWIGFTNPKVELDNILKLTTMRIKEYFPEYKIYDAIPMKHIKYEPKEIKVVIDNIKDIPEKIADPIKELLGNMKNENELIGLISKVYKEFEHIKKTDLQNLNDEDKSIYGTARDLVKKIANNVDAAKGHKGKSMLTIKDIAHNFALNASLIQKLINLNKEMDKK